MRIASLSLQGFRAFRDLTRIDFGSLTTIVGRNDSGKSSILHALDIFFNGQPDDSDFNRDLGADGSILIQISLVDLPQEIELEEDVKTNLVSENLTGGDDRFTIRRVYNRKSPKKPQTSYMVLDFADETFANLCSKKERELNELGKNIGLDFKKSGAGITNKLKRAEIREFALAKGIPLELIEIQPSEAALSTELLFPEFSLFRADESLSEEATAFQKEFKAVVETAVSKVAGKADIEKGIADELDREVSRIHEFLSQHTDEVASIRARPSFKWKDLISFYLECKDSQGKEIPFSRRGSGLRRLLMVAYFQYLSQRQREATNPIRHVYAIEEPETYLHPGAQRVLLESFKDIARNEQILVSSHSPVFAGSTDVADLILITRVAGMATGLQGGHLDHRQVAEELGVEPADSIYGYKAAAFLEGPEDCEFFQHLAAIFRQSGHLPETFEERGIGLIPGGGDNLKGLVGRKAMGAINKRFAVILDSDRKTATAPLSKNKTRLKAGIEADGGLCFILRKREIENYLHPRVIQDATGKAMPGVDLNHADMKSIFGTGICGLISHMSAAQILERDAYQDQGVEKHELLEICLSILELPQ